MINERITENFVRDHFKADAHFCSVKWEEQKSNNKDIVELLKGQSKTGGKGSGYPEFIISFPTNSNYLIVVECKAEVSKHASKTGGKPKDYAIDGVLHYAKALSERFNVVAIAVSGQTKTELLVAHFYWKKGSKKYIDLTEDTKLLSIDDYMQLFADRFFIQSFYTNDIAFKAKQLNEEFNDYSIPEYKRCTMATAMLLALIDDRFKQEYDSESTIKALGNSIISAINAVFEAEKDIVRSKTVLLRELEHILNEPLFLQERIKGKNKKEDESTLQVAKGFIDYLERNVYPLVEHSNIGYDVLGRFYIEFIRYAGSEQKQGLVLTPSHITELFCELAEINIDDIIYDPCCGTGGFLVAAMQRLFKMAGSDGKKRENIRKNQICGCELRSDMFTYACASMRFRGDGKSNIYNGDCFHHERNIADNHKPTIAFLNPPYDVGNAKQMEFIEHAINALGRNGKSVVAIVQMSCCIKNEKDLIAVKQRLLAKHHLKAVISMPDDLFYPVGVVTSIIVLEANKANKGRKTWFGYFKDDGFEKRKNLGRIDARGRYEKLKERLLSAYRNLDEIPGFSVRHEVKAEDKWCAEAYMETDYLSLCDEDFIRKMRDYAAFRVLRNGLYEKLNISTQFLLLSQSPNLATDTWKWFTVGEILNCQTTPHCIQQATNKGGVPFVSRSAVNNGVSSYVDATDLVVNKGNCITIGAEGIMAFYQNKDFVSGVKIYSIRHERLNQYIAMFIATILDREAYRYNYGNARILLKLQREKIKLPATSSGNPDWDFMEHYIKSLPYSACLQEED